MTAWLVIALVFAVLFAFYLWVNSLIDFVNAARRGEELSANKERERSSSWQQQSS